jgi:hypothetical protein
LTPGAAHIADSQCWRKLPENGPPASNQQVRIFSTLKPPGSLKGKSLACAIRRVPRGQTFFLLMLALLLSFALQTSAQAPQTSKPSTRPHTNAQNCGPLFDDVLKCPRFGFTYKVTYGWVDRTGDMQEDPDESKAEPKKAGTGETLLAVFERPPGAPSQTINSAVVIAAESLADYHGIKQAADYFGPVTELAQQRGFKVVNEPYAFKVGTKQLVRGDVSKERGKLTMWQSSLVMIEKGYIVSFTFVGGSEDEVQELIERLNFVVQPPRSPR